MVRRSCVRAVFSVVVLMFSVACGDLPTAPSSAHAPQLRWDIPGPANATTVIYGLPCGRQTEMPPYTTAGDQLPVDKAMVIVTWHTLTGRDVLAVFTRAGEDFGICAWVWAQ